MFLFLSFDLFELNILFPVSCWNLDFKVILFLCIFPQCLDFFLFTRDRARKSPDINHGRRLIKKKLILDLIHEMPTIIWHSAKSLTLINPHNPEIGIFISILQMKKLKLKQVKWLGQGHLVNKWQSQVSKSGKGHGRGQPYKSVQERALYKYLGCTNLHHSKVPFYGNLILKHRG